MPTVSRGISRTCAAKPPCSARIGMFSPSRELPNWSVWCRNGCRYPSVTFATPPSNQPFASGSVLRGRRKSAPGFVLISEVSSTLTESAPAIPWPAALYAGRFTVLVATAGNADASSRTTAAATVTARERRKRAGAMAGYYPLLRLELDVLIRRRPGIVGEQAEARLAHA